MTVGIYGIFDSQTDECLYVGLSSDIDGRWRNHRNTLKNGSHRADFVEWFENHNCEIDSMNFKVLEECEDKESVLNSLEFKWFDILSPRFAGKIPGENERWKHSENAKESISKGLQKYHEEKGTYEEILCPCGKQFSARVMLKQKYCSNDCRYNGLMKLGRPRDKRELCLQCKTNESSLGNRYCSQKCFGLSNLITLDKDRLFDLYWNQELSLKEIAEIEKVSRQTVFNKMKQFEIPRR